MLTLWVNDIWPFSRLFLLNFYQGIFDSTILELAQAIRLRMICRGNSLLGTCHFMNVFGDFIYKLLPLILICILKQPCRQIISYKSFAAVGALLSFKAFASDHLKNSLCTLLNVLYWKFR